MKANHRMGLLANIIVGLLGSALGMWILDIAGFGPVNSFTVLGMIVSIGGAALLIAIINLFQNRNRR